MCLCKIVEKKTYEASEAQAPKDEAKIEIDGCGLRIEDGTFTIVC